MFTIAETLQELHDHLPPLFGTLDLDDNFLSFSSSKRHLKGPFDDNGFFALSVQSQSLSSTITKKGKERGNVYISFPFHFLPSCRRAFGGQ